jgi:pimeloyl-ACP methyl ester carboxylesterase
MPANPVIVVPGITANYLDDRYALPPESIWSVLTKDYERAALHPDNLRWEAVEPALVRGGQLFEICYREMIEELRHNLSEAQDEPVPVYPFGYDWRQPLEDTAAELSNFVDEVIERTKLMRHYDKAGYADKPLVNLVAHSMGGLVVVAYLQAKKQQARVGKIVSLPTPFRGSFESVIKITTGTANLGTAAPSSREREAARMTPSLYYLLPDLPGSITTAPNIPANLFDSAAWQPSVIDTIDEYIRLHGANPTKRRPQAKALFEGLLGRAKTLRNQLAGFKMSEAGLSEDDWLCVIGVDAVTRVKLNIVRAGSAPQFDFSSDDRQNLWGNADAQLRHQTGDGTVPYDAALPQFLPPEKLVCVSPDDYGYWELQDRATTPLAGFHGILPNMDMLHRLITRYFRGLRDN